MVSLPPNAFKRAETATKTSILILRKKPVEEEGNQDAAFYALCTNIGHDNFGNPTPDLNQLPEVVSKYDAFKKTKTISDSISVNGLQIFQVKPNELSGDKEFNAYWLCPERKLLHQKIKELQEKGLVKGYWIKNLPIVKELSKTEKQGLKFQTVRYIRIRDVTESGIIQDCANYEYLYPVPKGADTMPQRQRRVKTNDVLVVRNPGSLGKVVVVPEAYNDEFVTDGFLVLRFFDNFIEGINGHDCALLFSALFRTQIVKKQMWYSQREAVQPDNKVETLSNRVCVPVPTAIDAQKELIEWARGFESNNEQSYKKVKALYKIEEKMLAQ